MLIKRALEKEKEPQGIRLPWFQDILEILKLVERIVKELFQPKFQL